jgi:hypothetical protein
MGAEVGARGRGGSAKLDGRVNRVFWLPKFMVTSWGGHATYVIDE